jgi:oxygen-independent coproporphyrinogen-3 oxidase
VLGVYVHVPFCSAICNYCNFNRGLYDAGLKAQYVDALLTEIRRAGDGSPADTIYFGGGTPSLLAADEIAAVVAQCNRSFDVSPDAEVTMEANPETVDDRSLGNFREAGVTRLSLGVQSFLDEELARLGRAHSAARARQAFHQARSAGFDNVSLDLMMWLPQQTIPQWLESVEELSALSPEHASLYMLELYPNAPLRDAMARAQWSLAPEDDAADMYLAAMERLERSGYAQYEISNVARPGFESRHNTKYWNDGEWLGFGCGAHSTRGGARWKNVSATTEYVARVARGEELGVERRSLTAVERLEEALFTGLRLTSGVDLDRLERQFGVPVREQYADDLRPFVEQGLLIYDGGFMRLSRTGMLLAHEVMTVFISSTVR